MSIDIVIASIIPTICIGQGNLTNTTRTITGIIIIAIILIIVMRGALNTSIQGTNSIVIITFFSIYSSIIIIISMSVIIIIIGISITVYMRYLLTLLFYRDRFQSPCLDSPNGLWFATLIFVTTRRASSFT